MDKDKKALLISFIPAFAAIIFLLYVLLPSLMKMQEVKNELNNKENDVSALKTQLLSLEKDQKVIKEVGILRNELNDFDIKVPSEDNLAIFLIDIESFAQKDNIKIISLDAKKTKNVDLSVQADNKAKAGTVNKKSKKKKEILPIALISIPVEIKVVGYYNDIMMFINDVEKYKRATIIEGIEIKDFKDDEKLPQPRIEMSINANIFKVIKQEVPQEVQTSSNENNKVKTKK